MTLNDRIKLFDTQKIAEAAAFDAMSHSAGVIETAVMKLSNSGFVVALYNIRSGWDMYNGIGYSLSYHYQENRN